MQCSYQNSLQTNSIEDSLYQDNYQLDFGIRKVTWSSGNNGGSQTWLINGEPFYCMGVNKHEDFTVILNKSNLI